MRQWQSRDDALAEVADEEQPDGQRDDEPDADGEHDLHFQRQPGAETPVAGSKAQEDDGEQIEHPLDEHGPERPAQRHIEVESQ